MYFDKFREKLKGYVERKSENAKYLMCAVTYMEDPMIFLKRTACQNIEMKKKQSPCLIRKENS